MGPGWLEDYRKLTSEGGYVPLVDWTVIRVTGLDRVRFVHGLCTNDIHKLAEGQGCEAFVTQVQGKTVGHVLILADRDCLFVVGAPGQGPTICAHWERYHIREDVTIRDETDRWQIALVGGPRISAYLERLGLQLPPPVLYAHRQGVCGDVAVRLVWFDLQQHLLLSITPREQSALWYSLLQAAGMPRCDEQAWEALRLELGWPMYGRDIVAENLPQEVARDRWAISFTKGCYLGQETVARIDALGHVNRIRRGLRWPEQVPCTPGTTYCHEGKIAAYVTSASYSPQIEGTLAMAYVRRGWEKEGTQVPVAPGVTAEVVALPIGRKWEQADHGTA